jgi:pimeloyl-ACP methyl ester carboxylesterase
VTDGGALGAALEYRVYGDAAAGGAPAVLLHGGPAAPGYLAPVGRVLGRASGRAFRVYEPFQRRSGGAPLTVARHVDDLRAFVGRVRAAHGGAAPALVGASWGAMLALAYAAAYPEGAACLALVGCGTFDAESRAEYRRRVAARTTPALADALRRAESGTRDPDERLRRVARVHARLQAHDPFPDARDETVWLDARGHRESWDDMLRLQASGAYPAAFAAVTCPVLMLHGDADPHPGAMIRASSW